MPFRDLLVFLWMTPNATPFSSITQPDQDMKNATLPRLFGRILFLAVLLPAMSLSLYAQQVPKITSFNLMDADTDSPLAVLTDGYVIPLDSLASQNLNVQAVADSGDFSIDRVCFTQIYNGVADYRHRCESAPPYALYGDTGGDYFIWNPDPGSYEVVATPFYTPAGGTESVRSPDSLGVSFEVTGTPVEVGVDSSLVVTALVLVDAETDQDLFPLEDGMMLYRDEHPDSLNIRAEGSEGVGSMNFGIEGTAFDRTESGQPWAYWGDSGGDYHGHVPEAGVLGLVVTPWSAGGGSGDMGIPRKMDIAFPGFVLVNADSDMPIREIAEGDTLDLDAESSNLNIQAAFLGVGSVVFTLDGTDIKTETAPPYAIAGDVGGDYHPWMPFEPGMYTLMATPFSQGGGGGDAGKSVSVTFTVMGELVVTGVDDDVEIPDGFAIESMYPNPFNPATTMRVTLDRGGDYQLRVFNVIGQLIEQRLLVDQVPGTVSVPVSMEGRATGVYLFAFEQKATGKVVTARALLMR